MVEHDAEPAADPQEHAVVFTEDAAAVAGVLHRPVAAAIEAFHQRVPAGGRGSEFGGALRLVPAVEVNGVVVSGSLPVAREAIGLEGVARIDQQCPAMGEERDAVTAGVPVEAAPLGRVKGEVA